MAPAAAGAKKQKKKWSKGKVKDKAQHVVLMEKTIHEKLMKEISTSRVITVATIVDRLKINGSLARRCLKELQEAGHITQIIRHHAFQLFTRKATTSD